MAVFHLRPRTHGKPFIIRASVLTRTVGVRLNPGDFPSLYVTLDMLEAASLHMRLLAPVEDIGDMTRHQGDGPSLIASMVLAWGERTRTHGPDGRKGGARG